MEGQGFVGNRVCLFPGNDKPLGKCREDRRSGNSTGANGNFAGETRKANIKYSLHKKN